MIVIFILFYIRSLIFPQLYSDPEINSIDSYVIKSHPQHLIT